MRGTSFSRRRSEKVERESVVPLHAAAPVFRLCGYRVPLWRVVARGGFAAQQSSQARERCLEHARHREHVFHLLATPFSLDTARTEVFAVVRDEPVAVLAQSGARSLRDGLRRVARIRMNQDADASTAGEVRKRHFLDQKAIERA
jgi:hypothetical protein